MDKVTVLVEKIFVFLDDIIEAGLKTVQLCLKDNYRVTKISWTRIGKIGDRRVRIGWNGMYWSF